LRAVEDAALFAALLEGFAATARRLALLLLLARVPDAGRLLACAIFLSLRQ
jgi:hypothetical protein